MAEVLQPTTREIRAAVVITAPLLVGILGLRAITGKASQNDFNSIYFAAWIMQHGNPATIYDFPTHLCSFCPVLIIFVFAALELARERISPGIELAS